MHRSGNKRSAHGRERWNVGRVMRLEDFRTSVCQTMPSLTYRFGLADHFDIASPRAGMNPPPVDNPHPHTEPVGSGLVGAGFICRRQISARPEWLRLGTEKML
jgi:hypothetical protein